MKRLEWHIARRYLAARRRGRFLSLITIIAIGGIGVGVMALITVIAVMTGLQQDLQSKILGTNPHVYVFEQTGAFRMSDWRDVLGQVREVPGVVAAQPFIMTQVVIARGYDRDYVQTGTLYGMRSDGDEAPLNDIQERLQTGELALGPTETGHPGLLVGRRLADRLGLLPGDVVQVASLENVGEDPMSGNPVPAIMEYEVTGPFETGMYEYDNQHMYAALEPVQELLDLDAQVSGIAVNVADPWEAGVVGARIDEALGLPYYTNDWMTLNQSLFSALKLEKLAMAIILFLIVLVAAFNIISTLIMVVTEKTREIGILKSMGMTSRRVLRVFMAQGLIIGLVGTLLGTAGGLGLVWLLDRYQFITLPGDVYFIDRLPVALDPIDLLLITGVSIVIAFAATIYPASQASRLTPVEAIRHE